MGDCRRDFTYVDDIVEGVVRVMANPPEVREGADGLPTAAHRVYNIGNSEPVQLLDFVATLQRVLVEEGVLPEGYDFGARAHAAGRRPGHLRGHLGARTRPRLPAADAARGRLARVRKMVRALLWVRGFLFLETVNEWGAKRGR